MRYISSFLLVLILLSGCNIQSYDFISSSSRGQLSLMGDESAAQGFKRISSKRIKGNACYGQLKPGSFADDPVVQWAVWSALIKYPGATALVDTKIVEQENCIEITGYPAKKRSR